MVLATYTTSVYFSFLSIFLLAYRVIKGGFASSLLLDIPRFCRRLSVDVAGMGRDKTLFFASLLETARFVARGPALINLYSLFLGILEGLMAVW